MAAERILVVPRSYLGEFLAFRGFRPASAASPEAWMEAALFLPRPEMETDPSYKQIIPYILLRHEESVFRYRRTKRAGESRLHHLYSIGVGGHINPRDENLFTESHEVLEEAAMRELHEEMEVGTAPSLRHVGFINDDDSEVGQVHLGVVYEALLPNKQVKIRESALSRGEWVEIGRLQDGAEYETWSQFIISDYLLRER
ncbi:MAG: NUDIX domain-containing protein [Candidatus Omnitrophota bacterium]